MSDNRILKSTMLKSSMIVGASVIALTMSACASNSSNSGSRYGNVYDYESGSGNCNSGATCGAVVTPPVTSRYGSATTMIGGQAVSPGVVYADCAQIGGMNCGSPAPVYTQPAPTYSAQTTSSYGPPVSCPSGTTPSGDGSCMMSGSGSYTSSTYTGSSSSYGEAVACPSGTTKANDGTCMMSGSGSYTGSTDSSYSSGSSYSSSSSVSGGTVDCPSGTTQANDGTCMMSDNSSTYNTESSNVTIYPTSGYTPPVDYTAPAYQPIRK